MPHGHSLVNQNMVVDAQALGTLAGRTTLDLNTVQAALTTPFLMLRVRYLLQLTSREVTDDGPLLLGIAHGDANTTEITTAILEANSKGPEDFTQSEEEDRAWAVYQNTLTPLMITADGTQAQPKSDWIKFSRKGIPALEDSGFKLFIFNAGSGSLTTGSVVNGIVHLQGV